MECFWCLAWSLALQKAFVHPGNSQGFSPVWLLKWVFKSADPTTFKLKKFVTMMSTFYCIPDDAPSHKEGGFIKNSWNLQWQKYNDPPMFSFHIRFVEYDAALTYHVWLVPCVSPHANHVMSFEGFLLQSSCLRGCAEKMMQG